jgi:hypothetical protein
MTEKNSEKSVKIGGVPDEIRTEYFPKANLEDYRQGDLLSHNIHEISNKNICSG